MVIFTQEVSFEIMKIVNKTYPNMTEEEWEEMEYKILGLLEKYSLSIKPLR